MTPARARRRSAHPLEIFFCECRQPGTHDAIDVHHARVRVVLDLLHEVGQPRGQRRNVFIVDLRKVPEHDQLGIRSHAADDRLQLKLGQPLRLINHDIGSVKGAAAHKVQ